MPITDPGSIVISEQKPFNPEAFTVAKDTLLISMPSSPMGCDYMESKLVSLIDGLLNWKGFVTGLSLCRANEKSCVNQCVTYS
jgi:hypothetical protein